LRRSKSVLNRLDKFGQSPSTILVKKLRLGQKRLNFLRTLGYGKGRVHMPYPNPEGITYYYFVPPSHIAPVEVSINTIK
jgi:hypothetical protein